MKVRLAAGSLYKECRERGASVKAGLLFVFRDSGLDLWNGDSSLKRPELDLHRNATFFRLYTNLSFL